MKKRDTIRQVEDLMYGIYNRAYRHGGFMECPGLETLAEGMFDLGKLIGDSRRELDKAEARFNLCTHCGRGGDDSE